MISKNYKQMHWRLMHHYIIHMVLVIILIHLGHHIISMMIIMVVITITTVVIVIDHSHHHLIVIILIIDFNLAIDSISNVLHHHSIVHNNLIAKHYSINVIVIRAMHPWTLVQPYVSNVINHVWLTTNVICSKAETTAITVACKDTSHVSAHPSSNNPRHSNNATMSSNFNLIKMTSNRDYMNE